MPKQLKVMVSSTALDLPNHRAQVRDACLQQGMFPIMMENLPASDAEAIPASLKMVDEADIYLLILAHRYGYIATAGNPAQISVTEHEYNHAIERKIPCLTFAMHKEHPLKAEDVETGEGAAKLAEFKERALVKGTNFFRSPEDLRGHVVNSLSKFVTFQPETGPQPLIHTLPTQQEIQGRNSECAAILNAMSKGEHPVYVFTAPGGFGKTALLAKVVNALSPDDVTLLDKVDLANGKTIEPQVAALLHIDCRKDIKMGDLFANAGRLIGEEQAFETIYNSEGELRDKLQGIFHRLSPDKQDRVWFVFDNFESMLNKEGEVADAELRGFFGAVFAAGHRVRALTVGREVPKFSRRERPKVLEAVGASLFEGLPIDDCVEFLKKNEGARGLIGSAQEIESVLKEFASSVHRIPLALVWAVGYLQDTSFTLKEILNRSDLFSDFDKEQARDGESYENKGVKRLHYEQLRIQPAEYLPMLRLLAFFKRPVPRGMLAHLMDEIELSKTLTRLQRNRLITHKGSADAHTQFINDPLAVNLYGLHPVICENEFFDELPDQEELFENAASECWSAASVAFGVSRFAYALELFESAEKLYSHLTQKLNRKDLLNSHAAILNSRGATLRRLKKLDEALVEYDKAIEIRQRLINKDEQTDLANELAMVYANKGVALVELRKLDEALASYEKAIAIWTHLVNEEGHAHLIDNLGKAYVAMGNALSDFRRFEEALSEYGKAIAILEELVNKEDQIHLENDLAMAYMNKGITLSELTRLDEALAEYDRAIAIRARLVNEEQRTHLASGLATVHLNKGTALQDLTYLDKALVEYDEAIAIFEPLVNKERQVHLARDLAVAYFNKGLALDQKQVFEDALSFYGKSEAMWSLCIDELNMYWQMTDLLKVVRRRLIILLSLERWSEAAVDVKEFYSRYHGYITNGSVDASLKQSAGDEASRLADKLRYLRPEARERLYAKLGDQGALLKSMMGTDMPVE